MTQEDKELLLKDLCARLPYGVKVRLVYDENTIEVREMGIGSLHDIMFDNADGLPYLRPMSSMTMEELFEFIRISDSVLRIGEWKSTCVLSLEQIDWFNAHHFDYRGLIEKGLALEAPKDMYKTE